MSDHRTLILLRHAKAESSAHSDKARPLAAKGQRQATELGVLLRESIGPIEVSLVSGARRTQETAEGLSMMTDLGRVEVLEELYEADLPTVLSAVREVPAEVRTVLVVGHEPTISQTARHLHDTPDDPLGLEVRLGVPTATACVLDAPEWGVVDQGTCHLREFIRP